MTPVEFYTARLDELEALARAGLRLRREVEHFEKRQGVPGRLAQYRTHPDVPWRWLTPEAEAELFEPVEPDPYILADIAAKRAVLAEHTDTPDRTEVCQWQYISVSIGMEHTWPCDTLLMLVQPFAAHPDYDPAWS